MNSPETAAVDEPPELAKFFAEGWWAMADRDEGGTRVHLLARLPNGNNGDYGPEVVVDVFRKADGKELIIPVPQKEALDGFYHPASHADRLAAREMWPSSA